MYTQHIEFLAIAVALLGSVSDNVCTAAKLRAATSPLLVDISKDGHYSVVVDGQTWLNSGDTYFQVDGSRYSLKDGSLNLLKVTTNKGEDGVGAWTSQDYSYSAGGTTVGTSVRAYENVPAVVFKQYFPDGAKNTSIGDKNKILSAFPNFKVGGNSVKLGYLAYGHLFVGDMGKRFGKWDSLSLLDGLDGGPLVLTDPKMNTLWMAPFSSFMVASPWHDSNNSYYGWGIMGNVADVPPRYTLETMIYYGQGMRQAVLDWGIAVRRHYQKNTDYRDSDITNTHLSYWSDNGAYYVNYYVKNFIIQNLTYEDAMLKYLDYAKTLNIPYRSIQYSVWYRVYGGTYRGVKEWDANPLMIVDGMDFMRDATKLQATVHNRWWAAQTIYAKQNGGQYNFIVEHQYSIPQDPKFWIDLFQQSRKWGFANYMQDWLNAQFTDMKATTESVDVARNWLMQMGEGARLNSITIQYCMALSRHILQSLEIPAVTQARASDDYQPSKDYHYQQWAVGYSGLFSWAVGLTPFKDTFWTTSDQANNFYKSREPYPEFQALVASLTAGPVGPGDMIGGTNASLLMRCCNQDGLILKPDRPAFPVDSQLLQYTLEGNLGPDGEVWTTFSDIGLYRFGIIFAAKMKNLYKLGSTEAFGAEFPVSNLYSWWDAPGAPLVDYSDEMPVTVSQKCTFQDFCLFYTAPVFTFRGEELVILGERSKWIPMSRHRFTRIQQDSQDFMVFLRGAVGEEVEVHYSLAGQHSTFQCLMSQSGTSHISFADLKCYTE